MRTAEEVSRAGVEVDVREYVGPRVYDGGTCHARDVSCASANEKYAASLERGKLYRRIRDSRAPRHGLIRVIDESGEDYLYPDDFSTRLDGTLLALLEGEPGALDRGHAQGGRARKRLGRAHHVARGALRTPCLTSDRPLGNRVGIGEA